MIRGVWQDIRFGVRSLLKTPGPTLIAVATLGLGIGATTAVFTYLDQAVLNPYLYRDLEVLVRVDSQDLESGRRGTLWPPEYLDIEAGQRAFEKIGAFRFSSAATPTADGMEWIQTALVSRDMLPVLGVPPVLGRWFAPHEVQPGADNVALLNYGYWRDRFGQAPDILGREIRLDDRFYKIIGVMPAGFFNGPRVYLPLVFTDQELGEKGRTPGTPFVQSWAKLKPGVSVEQAQAQMATLADGLREAHPDTHKNRGIQVFRPRDRDRQLFFERAASTSFRLFSSSSSFAPIWRTCN